MLRGDRIVRDTDFLLLSADQNALLNVALLLVDVGRDLRQGADQHPVLIAGPVMDMDDKARMLLRHQAGVDALQAAHLPRQRHRGVNGHRLRRRKAARVMPVLLLAADRGSRHGDRRQDQSVDRAEHDHNAQEADDLSPCRPPAQICKIFCRPSQMTAFHT